MKARLILLFLAMACCCGSKRAVPTTKVYEVSAYCHCAVCCGEAGQPTASGKMPKVGVTVAAPRAIPFGTRLKIQNLGSRIVEDRAHEKYDHRIDVFMANHKEAKRFGVQKLKVTVYGDTSSR